MYVLNSGILISKLCFNESMKTTLTDFVFFLCRFDQLFAVSTSL